MAQTYIYTARDAHGQIISGTIMAENETAVAKYVRDKGYYVTGIKTNDAKFSLQSLVYKLHSVGVQDLAVFCRQFSTLVDAGLSLTASLNILVEQTNNLKLKAVLKEVYKKVEEGEPLSKALVNHTDIFPKIMISMLEAGELGGVMDIVLERLAVQFEKEHKLNEKVKTAMIYPATVIVMAVLSVTFILTFVLPIFIQMYDNMKVELPLLTRMLLALSSFLVNHGIWLIFVLLIIGIVIMMVLRQEKHKQYIDNLIMSLPVLGMLWRKIAIARFSRTMSTLLRGGVPIITALETVKNITGNISMVRALTQAQISIREGLGLAGPLGASSIFTPMVIHMVAVGEETGELDKMLEKIADFYDSDIEDIVGRLSSMIEPILIGVLGVVIGIIIIAVVMPMIDVVTKFH